MNKLADIRKARKLSQADLAALLRVTDVSISRYEKEDQRLTLPLMRQLADVLETSVAAIAGEAEIEGGRGGTNPLLPEIDVRAGAGGGGEALVNYERDQNGDLMTLDGVRAVWSLPESFLRHELKANPKQTDVVEVVGDSMLPTLSPGDRVFVDMQHRVPSPPGIYALWDGFGIVIKRVEIVPNTDPIKLRISSDNANHADYERTLEEAMIIGRLCGRVTPL